VKALYSMVLWLLILTTSISHAQMTGTQLMRDIQYSQTPGKVTIKQDNDIVKLIDKHLYEESKRKGITGYRIRIYSNSGKQAYTDGPRIQAEFVSNHEGIRTYYIFDSPFYLLYVGDYRTHSNAMKFLKSIENVYPDAFIVRTKINYPAL
jgi:hypothetical protein